MEQQEPALNKMVPLFLPRAVSTNEANQDARLNRADAGASMVPAIVKSVVKHELSREQQLYYVSVTKAVLGDDDEIRNKALESLRVDPGLHQLLPYFAQFVRAQVRQQEGEKNKKMKE